MAKGKQETKKEQEGKKPEPEEMPRYIVMANKVHQLLSEQKCTNDEAIASLLFVLNRIGEHLAKAGMTASLLTEEGTNAVIMNILMGQAQARIAIATAADAAAPQVEQPPKAH